MWDNYEFGVNLGDNYRIVEFINGLSHVHGLVLQLDHIEDPTLDQLFRGNFLQGVLKRPAEPTWDYEDGFGDDSFDLSNQECEGKERLGLEFADRLFEHQVAQSRGYAWKCMVQGLTGLNTRKSAELPRKRQV
ncbi:hypothetical protein APHAL10511_006887 [Amanita phalloides]|nr:hypothetical protein APHAL10511_006887 [Amanita phalloides]